MGLLDPWAGTHDVPGAKSDSMSQTVSPEGATALWHMGCWTMGSRRADGVDVHDIEDPREEALDAQSLLAPCRYRKTCPPVWKRGQSKAST